MSFGKHGGQARIAAMLERWTLLSCAKRPGKSSLPYKKSDVIRVRHSVKSRDDLIDIWVHIARENPTAADRVYDRLEARVKHLQQFPKIGTTRPDIAPDARALVEHPNLILYRLDTQGVQIVRVLHSARNIDGVLFEAGIE